MISHDPIKSARHTVHAERLALRASLTNEQMLTREGLGDAMINNTQGLRQSKAGNIGTVSRAMREASV